MDSDAVAPVQPEGMTHYLVQPVLRAVRVLEYVAQEGRELTLTEVCTRLRLPKTSCFRYLKTLQATGLVAHDPASDRYRVGEKLRELIRPDPAPPIVAQALPTMRALRDRFNETVNLAERDGFEVVYREIVESRRSLRMQASIGARHPAHTTALGKALLSQAPPGEGALPPHLSARTFATQTSLRALRAELHEARRRGWASDHGENEDDSWCVGAAINARFALSLSMPAARMSATREAEMGAALVIAAAEIRQRLEESHGC